MLQKIREIVDIVKKEKKGKYYFKNIKDSIITKKKKPKTLNTVDGASAKGISMTLYGRCSMVSIPVGGNATKSAAPSRRGCSYHRGFSTS